MVVGQRETSTVPSQSLLLMNSPLALTAAESLARRLVDSGDSAAERVQLGYQIVLGRQPSDKDLRLSLEALGAFGGDEIERWSCFAQSLFLSTEFRYLY